LGRPWATSQNGQRRVQISPMIMKVAVPPTKHSLRFGQDASSHTVCSLFARSLRLISSTLGELDNRTRIQSGLRGIRSVAITFTGLRATFSAPANFTPCSRLPAFTFLSSDRSLIRRQTSLVTCGLITHHCNQLVPKPPRDGIELDILDVMLHPGHGHALVTTGINPENRLEIHIPTECQAVKRAALANPQSKRRNLGRAHVNPR